MFIYVIVCNDTLKIYIGQHKGNRLQKYLQTKLSDAKHRRGGSSHLYNAMRMHPKDSWSIHPLISGIEDKKELDETEQLLIYALKTQHPDVGYNICQGGEGFTGPHTEASKRKTSAKIKAWHASLTEEERQEQNRKISEANSGRQLYPRTPENEVVRLAAFHIAVAEGKTKSYGMLGKRHSEETLAKMRLSAQARGISPETHAKMMATRKAKNKTFSSISV